MNDFNGILLCLIQITWGLLLLIFVVFLSIKCTFSFCTVAICEIIVIMKNCSILFCHYFFQPITKRLVKFGVKLELIDGEVEFEIFTIGQYSFLELYFFYWDSFLVILQVKLSYCNGFLYQFLTIVLLILCIHVIIIYSTVIWICWCDLQ